MADLAHRRTPRVRGRFPRALIVLLLFFAFAIRLDGITAPPFDNAVARQFQSALLARMYYLDPDKLPAQERLVLRRWHYEDKPIEPPVMELLAAGEYRVIGHETLSAPRALSALWWVAGGLLLFLIASRLFRPPAALITSGVYLFLPFGVLASRAFQPDPLLVATMLAALLAIVSHNERPTAGRLGLATTTSAVALLVKPGILAPIIFTTFLAMSLRSIGLRRTIVSRHLAVFAFSTVPMFAWYGYATLVSTYLRGHFSAKVAPSLLIEPSFWSGWWTQVVFVLTYPRQSSLIAVTIVAAAAAGIFAAKYGRPRAMLVGLWAGYALYGCIFTAHISTHNYYSLPLIPIVALSLGAAVDAVLSTIDSTERKAVTLAGVACAILSSAVAWKLHPVLTDSAYRQEATRYADIGRLAGHSARTLYVDVHYGEPARYYGWTAGTLLASGWEERPGLLARRTLAVALEKRPGPTCLIFTDLALRRRLAVFESIVARRFAVLHRTRQFSILDLSRTAGSRPDGC